MATREINVIKELQSLLPPGFGLLTDNLKASVAFGNLFIPDAILTYKDTPFCLVEVKQSSFGGPRLYLQWMKERMVEYCQDEKLSYLLLLWKQEAYVLSEHDSFQLHSSVSYEEAILQLNQRMSEITEPATALAGQFYNQLKAIIKTCNKLDDSVLSRLQKITQRDCYWNEISFSLSTITLSEQFEKKLFKAILGDYSTTQVCRYTTRDSLYRILSSGKQSLCSIVGMNDKSECNYVDAYFDSKSSLKMKSSFSMTTTPKDYYITSCTRMDSKQDPNPEDNLSMWRMYADDSRGVCLVCDIDISLINKENYMFAPVSYGSCSRVDPVVSVDEAGNEVRDSFLEKCHPELDFIYQLLHTRVGGYDIQFPNWELWKHFFKAYEYRDEKEVRLLYTATSDDSKKWILANQIFCPIVEKSIHEDSNEFPLIIRQIILGPKFAERSVNLVQIRNMVLEEKIKHADNFECLPSQIVHYR